MAKSYASIIENIFRSGYKKGVSEIPFTRDDISKTAKKLNVPIPKNIGDLVYSFRYRAELPESIKDLTPKGKTWLIRPAGPAKYIFVLADEISLKPNENLAVTKVPDGTPGIVAKYALNDEQALLARVRYNRLIDIFSGVTTYSLQNHLRTQVADLGQIETDEIYVGVNKMGAHFVFPVQAKGGSDKLSIIQIEQDMAMCNTKFPLLICRPIAAQFMAGDTIALFEFELTGKKICILSEKHYKLVPFEDVTSDDLKIYRERLAD